MYKFFVHDFGQKYIPCSIILIKCTKLESSLRHVVRGKHAWGDIFKPQNLTVPDKEDRSPVCLLCGEVKVKWGQIIKEVKTNGVIMIDCSKNKRPRNSIGPSGVTFEFYFTPSLFPSK